MGVQKENVVIPDNSSIIDIKAGEKIIKQPFKAPAETRVVEGQTLSELSDVLMRDRKALGQEGFCVVVATVDLDAARYHREDWSFFRDRRPELYRPLLTLDGEGC